ncbi:MAG: DUF2341 domain-containing protein [Planctomycetes bacterium]|nr:DUF2341 domain-containing protein [Planctomycetota bacterium]
MKLLRHLNNYKKTKVMGCCSLIIGVFCFFILTSCFSIQYPLNWLKGFNYRVPFTITESGGYTLKDYQIKLEIQGQDANKPNYMDFSRISPNGNDVKITDNENRPINFWIQSWNNATKQATIWVKVPEIFSYRKAVVHLYYAPSASQKPVSDFTSTMAKLKTDDETRGLWHMDESTRDSSRHNNHAKVTKTGRLGKDGGQFGDDHSTNFTKGDALTFNGKDDFVQIPFRSSLDFNGTSKISIEAWIKPATLTDYTPVIYKPGSYALYIMADGKLCTYIYGPRPENYYSSESAVKAGDWSHITLTYDNEYLRFYINGSPDNKIALTGDLISCLDRIHGVEYQKSDLYFGIDLMPPGPNYFSGAMDEIRILSRVLGDGEIKADYQRRQYCPAGPTIEIGQEEAENSKSQ